MNKKLKRNICIIIILNIIMIMMIQKSYNSISDIQNINLPGEKYFFLQSNETIIQTFFSYQEIVEKVGFYISSETNNSNVNIRVYDNNTSKEYYNNIIKVNNQINQAIFFELHPYINNASGHEYYIELKNLSKNTIKILLSNKDNPNGHLLKNEKELKNDIALSLKYYNSNRSIIYLFALFIVINFLCIFSSIIQCKKSNYQYVEREIYIDFFRAISAISVLIVHLSNTLPTKGMIHELLEKGIHGVEVFFLISGYLGIKSFKNRTLKNYYLSRFIRIVPIYYLIIILQMLDFKILGFIPPSDNLKIGWFRYFSFLSTTLPSESDIWTNLCATWTIPCFVIFYFLLPFILKIIRNFNTAVITGIIVFIINEFGIDLLFDFLSSHSNLDFSIVRACFPLKYLWFFIVGIIAYFAIIEQKIAYFLVLLSVLLFIRNYNILLNTRIEWLVGASLLLISLYDKKIKNKYITSIIITISEYSYSLYLSHPLILNVLGNRREFFYNDIIFMFSVVVCIIVLTYILHNLVEIPCNLLVKKYYK